MYRLLLCVDTDFLDCDAIILFWAGPPMAHSYRLGLVTWWFESRSGPIFVIVVVHIQCSKLLKGIECTVLPMVLFTIKNP